MNKSLVVLKDGVFLLCEVVRLQCDYQSMSWFWWSLEVFLFAFMHPFHKIKVCITLLGFLPGPGIEPCRLFDVRLAENMLVEPVHSLSLVL